MSDLRCTDCERIATMIDRKGYVYCESHGSSRRIVMACRKLTAKESAALIAGGTVSWEKK